MELPPEITGFTVKKGAKRPDGIWPAAEDIADNVARQRRHKNWSSKQAVKDRAMAVKWKLLNKLWSGP